MIIEIQKLQYLITKYIDEVTCYYQSDTVLDGKKYKAGEQILLLHTNQLVKNGIKELDMQYNVTVYEYLSREFPVEFRRPVRWVDSPTLEQSLAELEKCNSQSKRKRFLYIVGDIYRRGSEVKTGQLEIVFRHGDKLDLQKWMSNKIHLDSKQKFFLRNSESGIILFGAPEIEAHTDEDDNWKKLNLVGKMMSHQFDKKFEISPDFIPNRDILNVDNPGRLAEEYINTNAKLVVFNETLSQLQKEALLQIKRYDPFVRMMVIPPIRPDNIDDILVQMKMVYNTDFWKK